VVTVKKGDALIFASKPTTVQCGAWQMTVAKDTIVLVNKHGKTVKIRNLYEHKPGSLNLSCQNKQMTLSGGQAIFASSDLTTLNNNLSQDPIPRRQLKTYTLENGQAVASFEFSLVALLPNQTLVSLASKDSDDQVITKKLYKMAACIMLVTYAHGPYAAGLNH
jgi:hypothetical protein